MDNQQQHGERMAVLESIAKTHVADIGKLKDTVASIDKRQEVIASTVLTNGKHMDERHVEIMSALDEVRGLVKATNGGLVDAQKWIARHEEWTDHKNAEFTKIGGHVDEIETRQEEVRRLLQTTTDNKKADRRWANWMWAAIIGIGMPLVILVMNVIARGLEKHFGL